jgi:hypothetical protein
VASGRALLRTIETDDEKVLEGLLTLSRRKRIFAPLAFMLGAITLLLDGMKVLIKNWRLMAIQVLPALWIWVAMLDLKLHVLRGKSFHNIRGWVLIPLGLLVVAITVASFFLNAVFAFAVSEPGHPEVRPAVTKAWGRKRAVLIGGSALGVPLAIAALIAPRWGRPWFALTLGVVVGLMMITYVAVPARLIGAGKSTLPRRDRLTASALSGALSAAVCTPPYLIGRVGILMLGSHVLLVPGIFVLAIGLTLQAGATGAVRAIKMSTRLAVGASPERTRVEDDPLLTP